MRKSALFMPVAAIAAGVAGFFLRTRELETVFDEVSGLAMKNAPVSVALMVLSFAAAVLFVIFSLVVRGKYKIQDPLAAIAPPSGAILVLDALIALLALAGAVYYAFNGGAVYEGVAGGVFVILAALSAISYFAVPLSATRKSTSGTICLLSVIPALFYCFWLVGAYRGSASDPVLLDYCYECLAICALILASYFQAGFMFYKARPAASVVSGLIAIYLVIVTLADSHAAPLKILLIAACCVQILATSLIISGLKKK